MKNKILFLINPTSGYGKAAMMAAGAFDRLSSSGAEVLQVMSECKGHLEKYAGYADLSEIKLIAVFGGDGTMHEVVNGLMHQSDDKPPIILFPAGSGNAFNHDLQCLDFETAMERLERRLITMSESGDLKSSVREIDVMLMEYGNEKRYAFNMIGWGLVTEINRLAEKMRAFGDSRYTLSSVLKIIPNPSSKAIVSFDDKKYEGEFSFVLIMNTKNTGKGMMMAPKAILHDGLMDVLIVRKTSFFRLLTLFPKVYSGKHISSPLLEYVQVKKISVHTDIHQDLNIDGEINGSSPVTVTIVPKALKIVV